MTLVAMLFGCATDPTGVPAPASLFDMQVVRMTTTDASSWTYRLTAASATGDYRRLKLRGVLIDARAAEPGQGAFTVNVPHGKLDLTKMHGYLSGGLLLRFDDGMLISTKDAAIDGQSLMTKARIHVSGPSMSLSMSGAAVDTRAQTLVSRGPVSGELRAAPRTR